MNIQRHFVSAGVWSSQSPLLPNYAIGVPHPQNSFGYDPLTIAAPTDPAEWPSAESVGNYYIDNTHGSATDTANTYGYPDLPRLTIPDGANVEMGPGTKMHIEGGPYSPSGGDNRWQYTCIGTTANPVFITGNPAAKAALAGQFRLMEGCQHLVMENVQFNENGKHLIFSAGNQKYITIRKIDCVGTGLNVGNGTVFATRGVAGKLVEYVVYYDCLVTDFGEREATGENDYHGFKPQAYSENVWIIGNTSARVGGDSVQVGDATDTFAEKPKTVYIARNDLSDNFENCIDTKRCQDVIISQNLLYDSKDAIITVHDQSDYVWIIYNEMYGAGKAVATTSTTNHFIIGNIFRDMVGSSVVDLPFSQPYNHLGVLLRDTTNFQLVDNTFTGLQYNFTLESASGVMGVSGNIFANRLADGYDIAIEDSPNATNVIFDYNLYEDIRCLVSATNYETAAAWQAITTTDANLVEGDPLFTNEGTKDFSLQATSPALNAGGSGATAYADFLARYSIDIKFDIVETARPQGASFDIGAHERVV